MAIVSVKIPQLGEGLQEARLVALLKNPGDPVKKDEPIYEIETDKAVTEIESPYDGTLAHWVAAVDTVLQIGDEVATMEVHEGTPEMSGSHDMPGATASTPAERFSEAEATQVIQTVVERPAAPPPTLTEDTSTLTRAVARVYSAAGGKPIPPRTRRLLREKGIAHLANQIPAAGKRLMPADVEAFLASRGNGASATVTTTARTISNAEYDEQPLNSTQRTLNFRMARGAQVVLPAVLETDVDWTAIQAIREETRSQGGPTGFGMLCWCIVQAMKEFPQFRSSLSSDGETLRTYKHVNLGIAVALEGDLLHTAVVRNADTLSRAGFFAEMASRIQEARDGRDQVDASTTLTVSNIGMTGMRTGIPIVVTPAVATVALGAVRDEPIPLERGFEFRKTVSMTMSFDHRLVNGVGAARFLNAIRTRATEFSLTEPG